VKIGKHRLAWIVHLATARQAASTWLALLFYRFDVTRGQQTARDRHSKRAEKYRRVSAAILNDRQYRTPNLPVCAIVEERGGVRTRRAHKSSAMEDRRSLIAPLQMFRLVVLA
jgi:hypothetical protein